MMTFDVPKEVIAWMEEQGCGDVVAATPVAGGCINNGTLLELRSGVSYFLKTNRDVDEELFEAEFSGLRTIRKVAGAPVVPKPFLAGKEFLLVENLNPASPAPDYWECFGRQMAKLHCKTRKTFGFKINNYIGSTPQQNPKTKDGHEFFAEYRLIVLAKRANEKSLLSREETRQVETIAEKLKELIPVQSASLLHGDLWSGNAICDSAGQPAIVDPAVYYGWAEADLAMTALFGGFNDEFYQAYAEVRPLEAGWRERFPIYNLYHLLNHLLLFGRGYHGQITPILNQYAN